MATLLRIASLGWLIWSLSLIWPEMNLALSWPVMAGLAAWLATAGLFYLASRQHERCPAPPGREQPDRPSRPVPLLRN